MLGVNVAPRWDRRRYPRASFMQTVELRSGQWPSVTALGRDVSLGGIGLTPSRSLVLGERVVIGLPLPSDLQISMTAEVRNIRQGEREDELVAGMCWVDASDSDSDVLRVLLVELGSVGLG
jgi:c-di-GMP-binding flagellar brake protein YcgR